MACGTSLSRKPTGRVVRPAPSPSFAFRQVTVRLYASHKTPDDLPPLEFAWVKTCIGVFLTYRPTVTKAQRRPGTGTWLTGPPCPGSQRVASCVPPRPRPLHSPSNRKAVRKSQNRSEERRVGKECRSQWSG